jgi:hypothetical protein
MSWDSDNRSCGGCGIILTDTDRFNRIMDAAENGGEGSTHLEITEDWIECLDTLDIRYAEYDEPEDYYTDIENGFITEKDYDAVYNEIVECQEWHKKNGSLYDEIG